jgi:hypothetical protein
MAHIGITHLPFALSLLPFFAVGIASPVTIQDWFHGRLIPGDGVALFVGLVVVGAWEWVILLSINSKKRRGQARLLGRELSSWYWAPPITFMAGVASGLILLCT